MGYTTDFKGVLKFKVEPKASELAYLKTFLSKDRREIGFENDSDVYESEDDYWYHIDLELTNDFSGLQWNGAEKTYGLPQIVNFVIKQMQKKFPKFELIGKLTAQGESIDDRWELIMEKGKAVKKELVVTGKKITCPNCQEEFILDDEDSKISLEPSKNSS